MNALRRSFFIVFAILFLSRPGAAAPAWMPLEPPSPEVKRALCALIDGDDVWVGYENGGLVRCDEWGRVKLRLTTAEKLPGNSVTALAKREKDLLIGTSDGLARRDEFGAMKVYTTDNGLPDNGITCLAAHDGAVFAGTMKGLVRLRGEAFDVLTEERGLPSNHVTALCSSPLGLLAGTTKGWAVIRGDAIEAHTPERDGLAFEWISAIAYYRQRPSKAGLSSTLEDWIVLGTAGGGLLRWSGGSYIPYTADEGGPGSSWVTALVWQSNTSQLWVGTREGAAVLHLLPDLGGNAWQSISARDSGLPSDEITALAVEGRDEAIHDYELMNASGLPQLRGSGSCPCATCTALIAAGGKKACPDCHAQPPVISPRTIQREMTWAAFCTPEGAARYTHKEIPHIGQGNFYAYLVNQGSEVVGMADASSIWAGIRPPAVGGCFLHAFSRTAARFDPWPNLPGDLTFNKEINTLGVSPEGFPVAGSSGLGGGLALLDSQSDVWYFFRAKHGLSDTNVTATFRDGTGLLVGTGGPAGMSGSIFRLREGKFERLPSDGLPSTAMAAGNALFPSPVTVIRAEADRIYVGTKASGLYIWNGAAWTRMNSLATKALSDDAIQALAVKRGVLYVGTKKGLDVFAGDQTQHVDVTYYGSYSNDVQALLLDETQNDTDQLVFWIGTANGITRLSMFQGVMKHGGKSPVIVDSVMKPMFWPSEPPQAVPVAAWSWPGNPNVGALDVCPFDGLPGNRVNGLAIDDLNLWIPTDNGLARLRK
ncbi:MAG TPA: hypothetical protein PLP29_09160 [Candidatus Ozemobacteraceae bacterium]|nr:hypothetical protein [Candidatus Ozemobacteraceae bacterium]